MAGYCGFSKSNNAIIAECEGKMTATKLARRLGVSSRAVKSVLRPTEWHHTSGWYNCTDYYDAEILVALVGCRCWSDLRRAVQEITGCVEDFQRARKTLEKMREISKEKSDRIFENCEVDWLEWSGSRKHPRAAERSATGCRVVQKNSTCTITGGTLGAEKITKRIGTRGFSFREKKS